MYFNEKQLEENGYEVLNFDPCWVVAFKCDDKVVEIYQRNVEDNSDEGRFFTLLHDEINVMYKAVSDEY